MEAPERYVDPEGGFEIEIPAGWSARPDAEEGGIALVAEDGAGVLHLLGFPHAADDVSDPAEELYAFLHEQGVDLEEDEVEDLELANGAEMAICEYIGEDEGGDAGENEPTFWLMGVATAPGRLVFASYSCPAGEEEAERNVVRAILASLRMRADTSKPGDENGG